MGCDALQSNALTLKLLFLLRDRSLTPPNSPLLRVRTSRIVLFLLIQLLGFGATFAVVQTIASIGFPVIILLLVPLRSAILPYLPFTDEELRALDGPTASPFVSSFDESARCVENIDGCVRRQWSLSVARYDHRSRWLEKRGVKVNS